MKIAAAPDGAELLWDEAGDGDPLLLLAGQATGMAGWGPTADALARHFRVIRYDHRGVGGSTKGDPERYTTRLLAEDAAAVLDAAGVGAAHLYGHSMGGRIAQWLAIDRPGTGSGPWCWPRPAADGGRMPRWTPAPSTRPSRHCWAATRC
ncbi:alpha/beta fold hydrolase [Arthrobacter silvisoli]|uniref:alpha/beta fold hydrolase n=1 Tax=Arthrobacter silvisoli TaxID=2291022 RepID=UPI001FEAEF6F|nr:alpha/beta fold hydrolase [Arthrobacter silvisoli]